MGQIQHIPKSCIRLHLAIAGTLVGFLNLHIQAEEKTLKIGVSKSLFHNISEADTRIALELLMREAKVSSSKIEIEIYSDNAKYLGDIREGKLDYFPLLTTDFLQIQAEGVPIRGANAAVKTGDSPCTSYLLISKKGAYHSIAEARGGTLIIEAKSEVPLRELWLNSLLRADNVTDDLTQFFKKVLSESNARKALLPVFFEQADLCLIDNESWKLLNELNPQLKLQLDVIAKSDPLLEILNCINESSINSKQLEQINQQIIDLNQSVGGRTLLKFTKLDHFVPFHDNLLTGVTKLQMSTTLADMNQ